MIIDTLANAFRYYPVHTQFAIAFGYVLATDLATMVPGTYAIEGDQLRAIFSNQPGMSREQSASEFECHNQHIDIQICISGTEEFGWKPRETCRLDHGGYDPEKDVKLYNDPPDMYFQINPGQFVILFPEDVHAPLISNGKIQKLVIKVKI